MGTSSSAVELARRIEGYGKMQGSINREAVKAATQVFKDEAIRTLKQDVGADQRLSRWRWNWSAKRYKPLKLGAGYDIKGQENAVAKLVARPRGPWRVLESGARPHVILPKRARAKRAIKEGQAATKKVGGSTRLAYGIALSLGSTGGRPDLRYRVQHPGTRPKNTWSRAMRRAEPRAVDVYSVVHKRRTAKYFGA